MPTVQQMIDNANTSKIFNSVSLQDAIINKHLLESFGVAVLASINTRSCVRDEPRTMAHLLNPGD
jgi:hypothetical protein